MHEHTTTIAASANWIDIVKLVGYVISAILGWAGAKAHSKASGK